MKKWKLSIVPADLQPVLAQDRSLLGLLLVVLSGLAQGGLAALALAVSAPLSVPEPSAEGVVGWVTLQHYPKRQESVYYALATLLVAATPIVCVAAWLRSARRTVRTRSMDPASALVREAFGFLPAVAGLFVGLMDWPHSPRALGWTLIAVVLLRLSVLAWPRRAGRPAEATSEKGGDRWG